MRRAVKKAAKLRAAAMAHGGDLSQLDLFGDDDGFGDAPFDARGEGSDEAASSDDDVGESTRLTALVQRAEWSRTTSAGDSQHTLHALETDAKTLRLRGMIRQASGAPLASGGSGASSAAAAAGKAGGDRLAVPPVAAAATGPQLSPM